MNFKSCIWLIRIKCCNTCNYIHLTKICLFCKYLKHILKLTVRFICQGQTHLTPVIVPLHLLLEARWKQTQLHLWPWVDAATLALTTVQPHMAETSRLSRPPESWAGEPAHHPWATVDSASTRVEREASISPLGWSCRPRDPFSLRQCCTKNREKGAEKEKVFPWRNKIRRNVRRETRRRLHTEEMTGKRKHSLGTLRCPSLWPAKAQVANKAEKV